MYGKKQVASVLLAGLVLFQALFLYIGPSIAEAADADKFTGELILSLTGAEEAVLGVDTEMGIQLKNNSSSAMAFNVGIELILPDGLELGSEMKPTTVADDSVNGNRTLFWQDVKDLAAGETIDFPVKVKASENYRVKNGKGQVQFGKLAGSTAVRVYASKNARNLYYKATLPNVEKTLETTVVPFQIKIDSGTKNVKGAGVDSNGSSEWGEIEHTITIVNNKRSLTTFNHLTNTVDGAMQLYGATDAPIAQPVNGDKQQLVWSNLKIPANTVKTIKFKTAYFDKEMQSNTENTGSVIKHGVAKTNNLTYSASVAEVVGTSFTGKIDYKPAAHDIVIDKSVKKKTGSSDDTAGYDDILVYTLTVKTNEYYDVSDVVVTDMLGDGQTFLGYGPTGAGVTPRDANPAKSGGTTSIVWDIATSDSVMEKKKEVSFTYEVKVDHNWTAKNSASPIFAGDVLENLVEVTGTTIYSGDVKDSDSTNVYVKTPGIGEEISNVNSDPISSKKQEVTVGDKVTFQVSYDAALLPAKQHNVVIYDYLPLGTLLLDKTGNIVNTSLDSTSNGKLDTYTINHIKPEYDKVNHVLIWNLGDIDENQQSFLPVYVKVLVENDTDHVIADKGAKNLVVLTYENSDSRIESERDEVELLYVEPKVTMNRTVSKSTDLIGGEKVIVTITLKNEGKTPAHHVKYTEKLPNALTDPIWKEGPTMTINGPNLEFAEFPPIIPGESKVIRYEITLIDPIGANKEIIIKDGQWTYTGQAVTADEHRSYTETETGQTKLTVKGLTIVKSIEGSSASDVNNARVGDWIVYKVDVSIPEHLAVYGPTMQNTVHANESFVEAFETYSGNGNGVNPAAPVVVTSSGNKVTISGLPDKTGAHNYTYYFKTTVKKITEGTTELHSTDAQFDWKDAVIGASHTVKSGKPLVTVKTPELKPSITPGSVSMNAGDVKAFILKVHNAGGNKAYNFTPSVTIPDGYSFVEGDGTPSGQTMTFNKIKELASDEPFDFAFKVRLDAVKGSGSTQIITGYTGKYYSTDTSTPTLNEEYESVSATSQVQVPSVTITNEVISTTSGDLERIRPGDKVKYKVVVTVPKGTTAYDLKVEDVFDDLGKFDVINKPEVATISGNIVNIDAAEVADASSEQLQYTYEIELLAKTDNASPSNGNYSSRAKAKWNTVSGSDPKETGIAQDGVTVVQPSLSIANIPPINTQFANDNQEIELQFKLNNTGTGIAYDAKVQAVLPEGLQVVDSSITNNGMYDPDTNTVTWVALPAVAANSQITVKFKVKTDPAILGPSTTGLKVDATLVQYASRESDPAKIFIPSQLVSQTLTVAPLAVSSSVAETTYGRTDIVRPGDEITYTVDITAPSNTTAFDVKLEQNSSLVDQEIVRVLLGDLEIASAGAVYELGDLSGTTTYTVVTRVKTDFNYGTTRHDSSYQAKITYTSAAAEGDEKTAQSSALTTPVGEPKITVELTADKTTFDTPNDVITFTMKLDNEGETPAYKPFVSLVAPAGVHITEADPGAAHDGKNLTWKPDTIEKDGQQTLMFKVSPDADTVVQSVYKLQFSLDEYYSLVSGGKKYDKLFSEDINVKLSGNHSLSPNVEKQVTAGKTAAFDHVLTNTGAGSDKFELALGGSSLDSDYLVELLSGGSKIAEAQWINGEWRWINITPGYDDGDKVILALSAGASQSLTLAVHVPQDEQYGQQFTFTLAAKGIESGNLPDAVQDKLTIIGSTLDGWTGSKPQSSVVVPIFAPGDSIKFSAISAMHIAAVKAYYTYTPNGGTNVPQTVEIPLSSILADGFKQWENVISHLPDDIPTGEYHVTYEAFAASGQQLEIDQFGGPNGANNPFTVKSSLDIVVHVTKAGTSEPIEDADVMLEGTTVQGKTDANGKVIFYDQPAGRYKVIVKHSGFADGEKTFYALPTLAEDDQVNVEIGLSAYRITLEASPTSILGDGVSSTELIATVYDQANKPVPGVTVTFTAPVDRGSFPAGNTAVTDANGQARTPYKSTPITGLLSERFPVKAQVDDASRNLHAESEVMITFEPGIIRGIVTQMDGGINKPVAGAKVVVSKDFDGNGVLDFVGEAITGADGSYIIGIPRGDVIYDMEITKPVEVGGTTKLITFKQAVHADSFTTNLTDNTNYPDKGVSVYIGLIGPDKNAIPLASDMTSKMKVRLTDGLGNVTILPLEINGTVGKPNVLAGNYTLEVVLELEPGKEIIINKKRNGSLPIVKVQTNGELTIAVELIDPFGTVTDAVTGGVIQGAHVELYYFDTARNQTNGRVKNTLVVLPILAGFDPNDNKNPQETDIFGKYAYMVYDHTDYYLKITKPGYSTYLSPMISVEDAIVQHDVTMQPIPVVSGGGNNNPSPPAVVTGTKPDVAISLTSDRARYKEGDEVVLTIEYRNKSTVIVKSAVVTADVPSFTEIVDAAGGKADLGSIMWSVGDLQPGASGTIALKVKVGSLTKAEEVTSTVAKITASSELVNLEDDRSKLDLLLFTDRFQAEMHKRYIKGYPDGQFKPLRSITRAEIAAIFARIMDLKGTVEGKTAYPDVPTGFWAAEYIEAVTKKGLFSGYKDKTFRPNSPISRAELATVIARYLELSGGAPDELHFKDISHHWAKDAIEQIYRYKIVKGYADGSFKPNENLIRAEAVTMINRLLHRGPLTKIEQTFPDVVPDYWAFGEVEESANTHEYTRNDDGSETLKKRIPEPLW